jgi:tRNA(fMet)-specific endonuclease VapC
VARLILDTGVLVAAARGLLNESELADVLAVTPVCDYDRTVAEHHAALLAHVQQSGESRGAHDLLIAATGRATGRTLLSTDSRARFSKLPDVTARLIAI